MNNKYKERNCNLKNNNKYLLSKDRYDAYMYIYETELIIKKNIMPQPTFLVHWHGIDAGTSYLKWGFPQTLYLSLLLNFFKCYNLSNDAEVFVFVNQTCRKMSTTFVLQNLCLIILSCEEQSVCTQFNWSPKYFI